MSKCPGLHCPKCPDGSGLPAGLIIIIILAAIIGSARRQVDRAVSDLLNIMIITGIALASAGALAAGITVAVVVRRHRSAALPRAYAHTGRESVTRPGRPAQKAVEARASLRSIEPPRSTLESQAERIIDADATADRTHS